MLIAQSSMPHNRSLEQMPSPNDVHLKMSKSIWQHVSHLRNEGVVGIHAEVAFLPAVCLHSWLRAVWTVTIDGLTQSQSGRNQSYIISHEVFHLLPAGYCPVQWHVKQDPKSQYEVSKHTRILLLHIASLLALLVRNIPNHSGHGQPGIRQGHWDTDRKSNWFVVAAQATLNRLLCMQNLDPNMSKLSCFSKTTYMKTCEKCVDSVAWTKWKQHKSVLSLPLGKQGETSCASYIVFQWSWRDRKARKLLMIRR